MPATRANPVGIVSRTLVRCSASGGSHRPIVSSSRSATAASPQATGRATARKIAIPPVLGTARRSLP